MGIHPGVPLEMVDKMSDLLSIHPLLGPQSPGARKEDYEKKLDAETAYAKRVRKPILATECCWGSLDDKVRVESIRYTLTQLQEARNWLACVPPPSQLNRRRPSARVRPGRLSRLPGFH